jgi:hypothetical protein
MGTDHMRSRDTLSVLFLILVFAGICPAWAAEPTNSDCLECHGEASRSDDPKIPRLESQTLPGSVHGNLTCIECHAGIASLPHSKPLQRTDCSSCHEKQADAYRLSVHGLRPFTGDIERDAEEAAKCVDCHGTHDTQPVALFRAPSHRLDIPDRCGECHPDIATTYRKSVHGQAAGAGTVDAPICTDCHGEHTITSPSDPTSRVAPRNIPTTCAACHEGESFASKYGLQTRRFSTYLSSYHGVVNRYGKMAVANCASCHGVHDIRPSVDPQSAIHPDNLGNTCGACHPGVEESLAGVRIHVEPTPESSRGMYYVRTFYTYFIGILMICFVAYITIEIYGTLRRRRS